MSKEERFFQQQLRDIQAREASLRDRQQYDLDAKQDVDRCGQSPRSCGISQYRSHYRVNQYRGGNPLKGNTNQSGTGASGAWDDSDLTLQQITTKNLGKAYWDREQRIASNPVELEMLKTKREGMIATHNAEQMALIDKEFKRVEGEKDKAFKQVLAQGKRETRRLKAKGDHPEYGTIRPPPKRHKSGAQHRFAQRRRFTPTRATRR